MQNNSYKKIGLMMAVVGVFIVFVMYGVLYFFVKSEVGYVNDKYLELQEKENQTEEKRIIESLKLSIENELMALDRRFARDVDTVTIISELERFAISKGVSINIDNISDELVGGGSFGILKISVTFDGSWTNLISFIKDLKEFTYAVKIEKIKFMKDMEGDKKLSTWSSIAEIHVPIVKENLKQ